VALRLAELVARNALNDQLPPSALASGPGTQFTCFTLKKSTNTDT
jgi:hypothetical protein